MNRKPFSVAVVGATGAVGRTMIQVLTEREFPLRELRLLASGRSAGRTVSVDGRTLEVGEAVPEAFDGVDIALFSAGASISEVLAPAAVDRGATVIDNSSAWRMTDGVPLVVSQVNPDDAATHDGIIANPNCSTMQLVPVLMALRDAVGIERVVVDTYQSVSGTGADAMAELEEQVRGHVTGDDVAPSVYPHRIAFNALPEIDVFLPNGYTKEEWKLVQESRKILHLPDLRISATAVRVPVFVGHSEAVHVELRRPMTPDTARALFAAVPGVVVQDDPASHRLPARHRRGRAGRGVRRPGPPGSVDRGRARARLLGRLRQPPQGRRHERGRDRRAAGRARLGRPGFRPCRRGHGRSRVTEAERRAALDEVAAEVRACTRCRLHEGRTKAVPGEGHPSTEVVFVGEGPGFNEDRQGRPFVGAAGTFLGELLGSVGWRRDEVFITNIVKCRPPGNRDPEPDEVAACAPYLHRQLEALDPALIVTLGRHSLARFMPGGRIGQVHGTTRPVDPETGARDATVFAMYHPAAALHQGSLRQTLLDDMTQVPAALVASRERREAAAEPAPDATPDAVLEPSATPVVPEPTPTPEPQAPEPAPSVEPAIHQPSVAALPSAAVVDDQLSIF